jgi:2-succinyl-6-hydroxy-2,4-cyclohexadiene-1-carboxylate synthase
MSSPASSLLRDCVGDGPRLVLVHGFTQTGASFRHLVPLLSAGHSVCTVDLPGHGRSAEIPADSLEQTASLLAASAGRASYLGYSLGGRVCLTLALDHPEVVERLILLGAHPGIADDGERAARVAADEALARRLVPDDGTAGEPLETFLEAWLSGPLFAHLTEQQRDVAARLENTPAGLAASLRATGTGTQRPSLERLSRLTMPVLLIAGANDKRFGALAAEMATAIGENASVGLVDGAGHAAHTEAPEAFAEIVNAFLAHA